MLDDNTTLTLACPHCENIFEETIADLKLKDSVICRHCTRIYMFDQMQFRTALGEARNAIGKLRKSLGLTK